MDFKQQVVLITGAGQGIGAAIAHGFAAEGSTVIVNDVNGDQARRTADAINGQGGRAWAIQADVSDPQAVIAMFAQINEQVGAITTLINNAGYVPFHPIEGYAAAMWERVIGVDLTGIFHCTQAALPHMAAKGGGFIVNIASVHASRTLPGTSGYAAAKAAVVGLTRNLALELGPRNIRVNCVAPGTVETDALRAYFESLQEDKRAAERDHMLDWQPLGRFGTPQDIANVVIFLCSGKAAFIHGTEIVVDGGLLARLF